MWQHLRAGAEKGYPGQLGMISSWAQEAPNWDKPLPVGVTRRAVALEPRYLLFCAGAWGHVVACKGKCFW